MHKAIPIGFGPHPRDPKSGQGEVANLDALLQEKQKSLSSKSELPESIYGQEIGGSIRRYSPNRAFGYIVSPERSVPFYFHISRVNDDNLYQRLDKEKEKLPPKDTSIITLSEEIPVIFTDGGKTGSGNNPVATNMRLASQIP